MIRYEVALAVRPELRQAVANYMQGEHIAEVLATSHFVHAEFVATEVGFRTTYFAPTRVALERYFAEDADHLRAKFMETFPDGVTASRQVVDDAS